MQTSNEPLTQSKLIISRWGGIREMAAATHLTYRQVREAARIGYFQEKDRLRLLAAAARDGVGHTAFDYIAHFYRLAIAPSQQSEIQSGPAGSPPPCGADGNGE